MTVYIITLVLVIALPPIINIFSKKEFGKKIYICLVGLWMFLLMILRSDSVGNDLANYFPRYVLFGNSTWSGLYDIAEMKETEMGYAVLNKILYGISKSPYTILAFTACIIIGAYCIRIYSDSRFPQFSFILFIGLGVYTNAFSALRQATATAICVMAYKYLKERNFKKYCCLIFLAATIHKSALIMLLFYFLVNVRVNLKILLFFGGACVLCVTLGTKIMTFITYKFAYYRYALQIGRGDGAVGSLIIYIFFLLIILMMQKDYNSIEMRINIYSLFMLVLFSILSFILPITTRIMSYFNAMLVIGIPIGVGRIKVRNNRMIIVCISYFMLIAYYLLVMCRADTSGIIPYEFIWNKKVW